MSTDFLRSLVPAFAAAALLSLSIGGVEVRAEPTHDGAIPTAAELFSIEAAAHGGSTARGTCNAPPSMAEEGKRRLHLAQLAKRLQLIGEAVGEDAKGWKPLNGRGYNYQRRPDPDMELAKLHAAARDRRAAPEEGAR